MDKIKIALLDSGIDITSSYFKKYLYRGTNINFTSTKYCVNNNFNDDNGHGSLCASVILKECNKVELYIIKIINKFGITSLGVLEYALERLLYEDIHVISISLSIVKGPFSRRLKTLCNLLCKRGIVIVCSVANGRNRSYPANFKKVFSVRGFILEDEHAIWERKNGEEFVIDSNPYLHLTRGGEYVLFGKSNSYACAKMSGLVAKTMLEIKDYNNEEVKKALILKAKRHSWTAIRDLKKSKRFPCFGDNSYLLEEKLIKLLCTEFGNISKEVIYKHNLFDKSIGLKYDECGNLLKKIERLYGIRIKDYRSISRYDFYSAYTLANMIKRFTEYEE